MRPGIADYLYYTGEIPEVAAILAQSTQHLAPVHDVFDTTGAVVGRIYATR